MVRVMTSQIATNMYLSCCAQFDFFIHSFFVFPSSINIITGQSSITMTSAELKPDMVVPPLPGFSYESVEAEPDSF
jgi:hypothetical protein